MEYDFHERKYEYLQLTKRGKIMNVINLSEMKVKKGKALGLVDVYCNFLLSETTIFTFLTLLIIIIIIIIIIKHLYKR